MRGTNFLQNCLPTVFGEHKQLHSLCTS